MAGVAARTLAPRGDRFARTMRPGVRRPWPWLAAVAGLSATPAVASASPGITRLFESPPVHALDLAPDGRTLALAHTVAGEVWLFDLRSGDTPPRERARIVVGIDPVSVRFCADGSLWVVNQVSDSVQRIDATRAVVTASMHVGDEPADLLCAADSRTLYVSSSARNRLDVLTVGAEDALRLSKHIELGIEEPRAMTWGPDGLLYVAAFESGNRSTILAGSVADPAIRFPPNVVSDPAGPYGGRNPPPNAGGAFKPVLRAGLPAPPAVSLIVAQDADGRWRDDNRGDWSAFVDGAQAAKSGRIPGWSLLDRDVAVVDPDQGSVRHIEGLMHLNMALAATADGALLVVGSNAHNRTRFEPNLRGRFADMLLARVTLTGRRSNALRDLNPQLRQRRVGLTQSRRQLGFSDPRAVLAVSALQRVYAVGQGSHTLIELDAHGVRKTPQRQLALAAGPVALVWSARQRRLFAWSHFAPTLSVIDPQRWVVEHQVRLPDPVAADVRAGQAVLFSSHPLSGTGHLACATCHVDARTDRLAWDLGDPGGTVQRFDQFCQTAQALPCGDWHPMKGPMLTQTLFDIVGKEPLHWRGDRSGLAGFADTFVNLLGSARPPAPAQIDALRSYLGALRLPPNPWRAIDNQLPEGVDLSVLAAEPAVASARTSHSGDPRRGLKLFTEETRATPFRCASCHTLPSGAGTDRVTASSARPLPRIPGHDTHLGIASVSGLSQTTLKIPALTMLYDRIGFRTQASPSLTGFGYGHDGSVPSLREFLAFRRFDLRLAADQDDVLAFLLAFTGGDLAYPIARSPLVLPAGPSSQDSPAALGRQWLGRLRPDGPTSASVFRQQVEAAGLTLRGSQGGRSARWDAVAGLWQMSDGQPPAAWHAFGDRRLPVLLQAMDRDAGAQP